MMCCAFFDKETGECIETMEDHIMTGLELIEKRYIGRNYGTFLGKLLGLQRGKADELLRLAYIFHDVGKGLEEFQKRKQGFKYHEYYSALIAREILKDWGKAGIVASTAILLHHHDWIRDGIPQKKRLKLCPECRKLFKKLTGLEVPETISATSTEELTETFRNKLRSVYAILLPVVVADNFSASKNRLGKGTYLGKEILESSKLYGVV